MVLRQRVPVPLVPEVGEQLRAPGMCPRHHWCVALGLVLAVVCAGAGMGRAAWADARGTLVRAALAVGAITHVMVIDLENENYADTFGPASPAVYLNTVLVRRGQRVPGYFGTSHLSLGNYIAQISGQGTNALLNSDCMVASADAHAPVQTRYVDVEPGTDAADQTRYPGQVLGVGCIFPAAGIGRRGAQTIGDQLDRRYGEQGRLNWRAYAEDMGDDLQRDHGTPDPLGGARCAHPPVGGLDETSRATPRDQYTLRHNPFLYFHSVIDDAARCESHVVPLGRVRVDANAGADRFAGHLYEDLRREETTPRFLFVTPNLCNDGHDGSCAGPNVEGTRDAHGHHRGGLVAADLWLRHWMPMIFQSPAYASGKMLVVLTFDESGVSDTRACAAVNGADCHAPTGPNIDNPGYSPMLARRKLQSAPAAPGVYAGGGQIGAVLFSQGHIVPGSVNRTGSYNHYSALRSYEDLLGLTSGGDDGRGHLGFAATPSLAPFGADVFNAGTSALPRQ